MNRAAQIADSARKMISYPWRYRRVQIVQFGVSRLSHRTLRGPGQKIDELLQANTGLTRQVRDLTGKVYILTQRLCATAE
jgi:hypothetical protein